MKKGVDRRRRTTSALTADLRDPLYDLRYDQLYDRLWEVLSELPVIESLRDTVGAEAEYLCSIYWSPPNDFVPDIKKQDERDLRALRKRVNALRLHINNMSENARAAMKIDNGRHQLVRIEMTAERILEPLGDAHRLGRPREGRAERIASAAASVFGRLTGKPSTLRHSKGVAYGPFLNFVKAVFEACRVTASAEAQAKAVRRKLLKNLN
jgi:hypothetical protein